MDKVKNAAKRAKGDHTGMTHVNALRGKGTGSSSASTEHTSRPLATLKDPDAFGPPPKNVNFHGGAAVPNAITPDRRGLGTPLSAEEIRAKEAEEAEERRQEEAAARKPAPPPVPYRVNTTGIDTRNLPKPPVRRMGQSDGQGTPTSAGAKPKPHLPPRLPPRQNSHPNTHASEPPPTYTAATAQQLAQSTGDFNVGALNRLGKAGVSVPGFGIGSKPQTTATETHASNPWRDQSPSTKPSTSSPTTSQNPSLNGLQSRFSKLSTASPPPSSEATVSKGTSFAQKQEALRTASAFQKDPSSISLSDAKATASTANNFRERHGEQVTAGGKWAGAMNKRYDVGGKVNGYSGNSGQASPAQDSTPSPWANEPSAGHANGGPSPVRENPPILMRDNTTSPVTAAFKKAPPPPPAARRTGPPPVPLGSKPRG